MCTSILFFAKSLLVLISGLLTFSPCDFFFKCYPKFFNLGYLRDFPVTLVKQYLLFTGPLVTSTEQKEALIHEM